MSSFRSPPSAASECSNLLGWQIKRCDYKDTVSIVVRRINYLQVPASKGNLRSSRQCFCANLRLKSAREIDGRPMEQFFKVGHVNPYTVVQFETPSLMSGSELQRIEQALYQLVDEGGKFLLLD